MAVEGEECLGQRWVRPEGEAAERRQAACGELHGRWDACVQS